MMTEDTFLEYWKKEYPDSLPINHTLKWKFKERWFRIHSLPNSKRYAKSQEEYEFLLDRQNQLIDDLTEKDSEMWICFGLYTNSITNENYKKIAYFEKFQKVSTIDLNKELPEEYDLQEHEDPIIMDIFVKSEKWKKDSQNKILKAIADDEIRAMFIFPNENCIVAPYDGGVDIIVESTGKRDELKSKYKDFLPTNEYGL